MIKRKQKIFKGTPKDLEEVLNKGWYLEEIIHCECVSEHMVLDDGEYTDSIYIIICHLSKEIEENESN